MYLQIAFLNITCFFKTIYYSINIRASPQLRFDFEKFRSEEERMAFNKAKEEYKWKQWKEAEETKMRELDVAEETILKLREQDWEDFKKERNYNEHQFPNSDVVEINLATMCSADQDTITTVKSLLDEIEDEELFHLLCAADRETLQIVLFRMLDIPTEQIAKRMGLTPNAIYLRINRLKEKIKKLKMRERK
jgi:RNA polymerase sigma-70 factor (ECF subfamily)